MATTNDQPITLVSADDPSRRWLLLGLDDLLGRRVERLAALKGISQAELIRRAIEFYQVVTEAGIAGNRLTISAKGEFIGSSPEEPGGPSTNGSTETPASPKADLVFDGRPVAPPLRYDEHGRLLEFTEEESRQRREAASYFIEEMKSMPSDPAESDEEFFRAMDESRPDAPLFKGL